MEWLIYLKGETVEEIMNHADKIEKVFRDIRRN